MFSSSHRVSHPGFHPLPSTLRTSRAKHSAFLALAALGALSCAASAQKATATAVNLGTANVCPSGATTPSPCSQTGTVTFQFTAADTGISPSVVTQGAANLDFTDAGGGTCNTNGAAHSYANGDTCTVNVSFKPIAPGTRMGAVVLSDSAGVAATGYVSGIGTGPQIAFNPPTQKTIYTASISGLAVDASGNIYFAVSGNVMKAPPGCTSSSCATTLGGHLDLLSRLAVDGAGNVYVSVAWPSNVMKIPPACSSSSCMTPVGGGFMWPLGVAVDGSGNIYVVDHDNRAVKEIPPGCASSSCVTTLGGGFWLDTDGVAVDSAGNVYVIDGVVKRIPPGCTSSSCVTTVGGGFDEPWDVKLDAANNVYVLSRGLLTRMPPDCTSSSCVTILIDPLEPLGDYRHMAVDSAGNVFIAGENIRELELSSPPSLSFAGTPPGMTSIDSPQIVTLLNTGNSTLNLAGVDYPTDFPEASGVNTDCTSATELEGVATCTLSIDFSPLPSSLTGSSMLLSESVALTDNNLNGSSVNQQVGVAGTEQIAATLTSPAPGSALTGPWATFSWSAVSGATAYKLWIGTSAGKNDVYTSAPLTTTSATPATLPLNGETLYVTLITVYGSNQVYAGYVYTAVSPEVLTSPTPNSVLAGPKVTFHWNAPAEATAFRLWIGTSVGSENVYSSGLITATSATPSNLPLNGEPLYVRLYTYFGSSQAYADYTFTAATNPGITSPTPRTVLAGPQVTFTWSTLPGATAYKLWIGTSPRTSNLYTSGSITATSATPKKLPVNGKDLCVTLVTVYGANQAYADYVYTAASTALTSPAPNSTLAGPQVTFNWNVPAEATGYRLWIGNSAGSENLYSSGLVTAASAAPSRLPVNGEKLYVRLYTYFGSYEVYTDYTYTAGTNRGIMYPGPNTALPGPQVTFWLNVLAEATAFRLWIGTSAGSENIYSSGLITATTVTATNLPTDGEKLYVRLYTYFGSYEVYQDYTYTAATKSTLTSPTPGTVLAGSQVTFSWSAATDAADYKLWIGTAFRTNNLYTSGAMLATSRTPTNLPTNGEKLYVTLVTVFGLGQAYADYLYTAATPAALTSPAPGTVLTGSQATFSWSAAPGSTAYKLWIGTAPRTNTLYTSGSTTATSTTPTTLPTNGEKLYVTLITVYPSSQVYADYVYTAYTAP